MNTEEPEVGTPTQDATIQDPQGIDSDTTGKGLDENAKDESEESMSDGIIEIPVAPIEKDAEDSPFYPLLKISPKEGDVLSVDVLIEALYSFKKNGVYLAEIKGGEIVGGTNN